MAEHSPELVEKVAQALADRLWLTCNDRMRNEWRKQAIAALNASGHANLVGALRTAALGLEQAGFAETAKCALDIANRHGGNQ